MSNLFVNAIQSIQLGVEDYQNDDPKRAVSAIREFLCWRALTRQRSPYSPSIGDKSL